jgi:quercetin dioxygenase-like cupin family protein
MRIQRLILAVLATAAPAAMTGAAEPPPRSASPPTVAPTPEDTTATATQQRAIRLASDDASLRWGPCPPLFAPGCQVAVLQGDPAKPQADIFFRIPGGYVIPPHWHSSAEHMILVAGELDVHYRGQPAVTLKVGDYAYGPAKLPHLGRCRSQQACQLFISFDEPVDAEPYAGEIR